MNCENYLCVYQRDGMFTLEKISIDIQGQCDECMYPQIDGETLAKIKQKYIQY